MPPFLYLYEVGGRRMEMDADEALMAAAKAGDVVHLSFGNVVITKNCNDLAPEYVFGAADGLVYEFADRCMEEVSGMSGIFDNRQKYKALTGAYCAVKCRNWEKRGHDVNSLDTVKLAMQIFRDHFKKHLDLLNIAEKFHAAFVQERVDIIGVSSE